METDFSGLHGRVISALAVNQVYLGGPETRIRAEKSSAEAEISYTSCPSEYYTIIGNNEPIITYYRPSKNK